MSTGMPRRLPTFWQLAWTLRRVRGDRHGINQGSGEGVRATQKEIFVYKPRLMPVLMDPISFFVPDRILRRSVRNFVPRGLRWADSRPAKIYCKLADNRPQEDDDPTDSNFCCLSQGHYSNIRHAISTKFPPCRGNTSVTFPCALRWRCFHCFVS